MNRKERRRLAKKAGVRFGVVNQGMAKRPPVYLGIRRFKNAVNAADRQEGMNSVELKEQYKDNAWRSKRELEERRALEAAEITEAKELSDEQMEKIHANDNGERPADA